MDIYKSFFNVSDAAPLPLAVAADCDWDAVAVAPCFCCQLLGILRCNLMVCLEHDENAALAD